ncbi:MAG TPA: sugar ABC transporter ATP-binding protein [Protaetiibacter sp.]|nr:sugar ABC transporter ATP-binding protein [Protaetiibacter sp.]
MIKGDSSTSLLSMRGITKSFAGVHALKGVDLDVRAGEVHCVLGQNGAGKSTLIKILSGAYQPDGGELVWQGETVTIPDPVAALDIGIATMYQELDVVDGLSIAENIFLGHELSTAGVLHRGTAAKRTRELLTRLGHGDLNPHTEVETLSAAGKQIVSMARALSHDAKLIIMDEPSAVLDSEEVKNLFRVVEELTTQGIAIIYISHRLEEIRQIGDRITVIKDGASMASGLSVADTTTPELIRLMTGRNVEFVFPPRRELPAEAPVVLDVDALGLRGIFTDVSFEVRAGEVVGLAGLVGSGRSEILETIYGARRASTGHVSVAGDRLRPGAVDKAVTAGIGLSPEERKSQGLILDEPIFKNVTLSNFARYARGSVLNERRERAVTREQIEALELRPADPDRPAGTLSGGNQQKIMLARWLVHGTEVLLLDEPTRGVDVGARAEIYTLVRRLADRVLVVSEGRVVHEGPARSVDEHQVLDLVMEGSIA